MSEIPVRRGRYLQIDLGEDDPLYVRSVQSGPPDRRRVSLRWLAGSILTGICSAALVGGSLQAAIGPQAITIIDPAGPSPESESLASLSGSKGDRVRPLPPSEVTRRTINVSTVKRTEDGDLVRVRPFTHIRTGFTLATPELVASIPAFNPLEIFSDGIDPIEAASNDSIYTANVDGEVTIKVGPLPLTGYYSDDNDELSPAEIEVSVRTTAPFLDDNAIEVATLAYADPGRYETAAAETSAIAATNVAIIPENVSFMEKTGNSDDNPVVDERVITVTEGDALTTILQANGVTASEALQIQSALLANFTFDFRAGQMVRLELGRGSEAEPLPVRMALYSDEVEIAAVARSDTGIFVPADEPLAETGTVEPEADTAGTAGRLPNVYSGIWQTALAMDVPGTLIEDLIQIFAFDVDFQSRLTPSDRIEIVYSNATENEQPEIIFTSITLGGETRNYYRFRDPNDGVIDFYDETGRSAKKFLMRKPMAAGRFRSAFGMRRHPILGRYKMHTGVDWAAPRGTAIMAAGNGVVTYAKWKSGYGKHIKIGHTNGYTSTYSHMNGYAKGITEGAKVRQGQIIGYVGSTGLSTGPHLHYEVLVNKRFVNPMKIRLPRGRVLQGPVLGDFTKERSRIDALIDVDGQPKFAEAAN